MEQVSVPLPFTREAILSLNNGSTTFEHARSLFNVDSETFKARLFQENIFVWNEFNFGTVRIHGGDYLINIFIKKLRRHYAVDSTDPFKEVNSQIERDFLMSPGSCKLTYKHPLLGKVLLWTDRDWHFAVEFSRARDFFMYLDLKTFPSGQPTFEDVSDEDASDEDASNENASFEDASDEGATDEDASDEDYEDTLPGDANLMEQAPAPVPFTKEAIHSAKIPKQNLMAKVSVPSPFTKVAILSTKITKQCVGFINGIFGWSKFLSTEIPKQDANTQDTNLDSNKPNELLMLNEPNENSVEQVLVPLTLTREAILSLNNGSTTFEHARSLFNVDSETFKARLLQERIFVWNEFRFGPVRIHGEDHYRISVIIKKLQRVFSVASTDPFKEVNSRIERDLLMSPGCCKLSYKHPLLGNVLLENDRDWHFAVEFSRVRGFHMYLDLKNLPSWYTADEDASDEESPPMKKCKKC